MIVLSKGEMKGNQRGQGQGQGQERKKGKREGRGKEGEQKKGGEEGEKGIPLGHESRYARRKKLKYIPDEGRKHNNDG